MLHIIIYNAEASQSFPSKSAAIACYILKARQPEEWTKEHHWK